ncbi:MAG: hypothetical protein J5I50_02390 [Chitinophagaceae bacterium]|nr:hypothetical protein [Chitinophagaceae bacterium]
MDTINLRLSREQAGNIDLLASIPAMLSGVKYGEDMAGRSWYTGKAGNLRVTVSENSVSVKNGSLTKFYLGDNLKMMSRGDVQQSFQKLSDLLHLPFDKADVRAFDFGKNISLSYPISLYLGYLGDNGRYTRLEQRTALYYKLNDRELSIYDKLAEMRSKGEEIPELYKECNILRYEKRYQNRVAKYFNLPSLKVMDLYSEDFYIKLVDDWYRDYLRIKKQKLILFSMDNIKTKEQMKLLGVLSLVDRLGGQVRAIKNIGERYQAGQLTKKQAHDLKELVRQSAKFELKTKENDFILELNKKMEEAVKYYR